MFVPLLDRFPVKPCFLSAQTTQRRGRGGAPAALRGSARTPAALAEKRPVITATQAPPRPVESLRWHLDQYLSISKAVKPISNPKFPPLPSPIRSVPLTCLRGRFLHPLCPSTARCRRPGASRARPAPRPSAAATLPSLRASGVPLAASNASTHSGPAPASCAWPNLPHQLGLAHPRLPPALFPRDRCPRGFSAPRCPWTRSLRRTQNSPLPSMARI